MGITLGRNIAALSVTRSLDRTTADIGRTFERLSSGARINRASDDAAGLAVASGLNHKSRVLTRAGLNASDAISVVNVAEAALGQIGSLLTRMRELAAQAANGSYSRVQRLSLEQEFLSLDKEIRRIGSTTRFNGLDLLGGKQSSRAAQTINLGADDYVTPYSSGSSPDGRYVTTIDGDTSNLVLIDTVTGAQQIVAQGASYSDIRRSKVLSNGDVAFSDGTIGEVFLWSKSTGQLTSLTQNSGGSSFITEFTISDDGSTIAFVSGANFVDGGDISVRGSAHPGYELWTMDLATRTLRLIQNSTSQVALGTRIELSSDGSYVVATDATLSRVFSANTTGATTVVRELTTNSGVLAGVSNAGVAYFRSTANPTGGNPGGFSQIFSLDHSSGSINQLTNVATSGFTGGRLSADGSAIYIFSTVDLANDGNSSGIRQLFSFDTQNPGFRRLTNNTTSFAAFAFVSSDGGRVFEGTQSNGIRGDLRIYDTTLQSTNLDFELGFGAAGNIVGTLGSLTSSIRGLGAYGLSSQLAARSALDRVTENLGNLNTARGSLGALLSRLSLATNIITSLRDEFSSAAGRILDADIATESANLTRQQILQQVGTAVLAQAKRSPQLAIQLLSL